MSVTPDHARTDRSPPPRRPILVLLYGALALVLATVLFKATESSTTTTTLHLSMPTTTNPVRRLPLSALVPGLTGTLQAVEGSDQLGLISWDADGPLLVGSGLPPGRPDQIAIDASGELLGVSVVEASSNTGTILVGSPSVLSDVGLDATSFVWHMTEPGSMAAISVSDDSGEAILVKLRVESGIASAVEPIRPVGPQDVVLAWGEWGFLLVRHQNGTNRIVLLDNTGEQVWSRPAHWAYASPTGDVLLSFYNNEIREFHRVDLNADPSDPGEWFELPSLGVTGVGWSPDGEELAVVSFAGGTVKSWLETYDTDGSLVDRIPLDWHAWDVKWSRDGRFVIMPGVRERSNALLFYDTDARRLIPVMFDHLVQIAVMGQ